MYVCMYKLFGVSLLLLFIYTVSKQIFLSANKSIISIKSAVFKFCTIFYLCWQALLNDVNRRWLWLRLGETLFHVLGRCRFREDWFLTVGLGRLERWGVKWGRRRELIGMNGLAESYLHLNTFPRRCRQLPFSIRRLLTRLRVLD